MTLHIRCVTGITSAINLAFCVRWKSCNTESENFVRRCQIVSIMSEKQPERRTASHRKSQAFVSSVLSGPIELDALTEAVRQHRFWNKPHVHCTLYILPRHPREMNCENTNIVVSTTCLCCPSFCRWVAALLVSLSFSLFLLLFPLLFSWWCGG